MIRFIDFATPITSWTFHGESPSSHGQRETLATADLLPSQNFDEVEIQYGILVFLLQPLSNRLVKIRANAGRSFVVAQHYYPPVVLPSETHY
jgi:hypothetical protein